MVNQEIAIAISATCFGMVVGFLPGYAVGLIYLACATVQKNERAQPEKRHRTKKGSRSKGRTIHTIGRAQAIKGFVADRPLAIEPIANPALAMKNISDTTLHRIIAAMIPPPESDLVGPLPPSACQRGRAERQRRHKRYSGGR